MTTETKILTDEQIAALRNDTRPNSWAKSPGSIEKFARAIERAVLQSLTADADRVEAAARALSKCLDYPWEFMTSQGHDSMRECARATINAAMEKQP